MKRRTLNIILPVISLAIALTVMPGCGLHKTQRGAAIGVGAGGTVGALVGKSAGNTAMGALIGGAVGGTAGAFIGKNMENQATEIQKNVPGATVVRQGNAIIVNFDSGLLFDADKTDIKPASQTNLQNLATTLQKNNATYLLIIGHADNREATDHMALSVRRAQSVKDYLGSNGIDARRLNPLGKGDAEPIADNKTEKGRALNRRVEIIIIASNKMRKEADTSGK